MTRLTLLLTLLIPVFTFSQIINIPDDYPTIQQGIDAAVNGDTVLVDTGTYLENINFNGKNIVVASHYLKTADTSQISNTIIDGSGNGSVVTINNGEGTTALICGFTIQHGISESRGGHGGGILIDQSNPSLQYLNIENNIADANAYGGGYGGGLYLNNSSSTIQNVLIENNTAHGKPLTGGPGVSGGLGGGIYCNDSDPLIYNVKLIGNHSYDGGGCYISGNSTPVLQNNNIRNNSSALRGGGICSTDSSYVTLINTNVINNEAKYGGGLFCTDNAAFVFDSVNRGNIYLNESIHGNDFFTFQNQQIHQVFVDTFTVQIPYEYHLSPVEAFNIDMLNAKEEQLTSDVFVSPGGDNSNSGLTEEDPLKTIHHAFCIMLADSINPLTIYLSEGSYQPSLNGEKFPVVVHNHINIKGENAISTILNAENSDRVIEINDHNQAKLSEVTLQGGQVYYQAGGIYCSNSNLKLKNIITIDNVSFGIGGAKGGGLFCFESDVLLNNVLLSGNATSAAYSYGGGIYCERSNLVIQNTTISDNSAYTGGSGIYCSDSSVVTLSNSIIWENIITFNSEGGENFLNVNYSNVEGSENGIEINGNGVINWLEGNIDQDPLFVATGNHLYQINDYSPCIDSGTPDTIGLNLPEYDLAGEVRIFNERIDIGAYEWNTFVGIEDASMPKSNHLQFSAYPNPFSTSTTISYELSSPQTVTLTFYNQFGKQVDRIEQNQSAGEQQVVWTPDLPGGVYYFRLEAGDQMASGKLLLMK